MTLESNSLLSRTIGWRTAAAVVITNMIGTGIFTTSGFIARDTGSPRILLALWVVGGLIALTGALAYAELGAAMPEAGGEYIFLREAYGPVVAYLSGWTSFLAGFGGAIAAALLAFASYISSLFPVLGELDVRLLAITTLWMLTAVHLAGVQLSGKLQSVLAAVTVMMMVARVDHVRFCNWSWGSCAFSFFGCPARQRGGFSDLCSVCIQRMECCGIPRWGDRRT